MKIVQLCPYAMDRPGGVQRHVLDLADWLTGAGHDTRIVAPPAPGRRPRRDGRLIELGRSRTLALHGTGFELSHAMPGPVRATARELRHWGADIVHMHTPWTPLLVWQMWRALRLPTVTTVHATLPRNDSPGLADRYIRRAARYFLDRSQATVTPSDAPAALLRQLAPRATTRVLPPATDLADWRAADTTRAGTDVSLLFLGRLEARKGVTEMLAAWAQVADRLPDATLTVAGDGPMRDAVASARLPRLVYAGRPDDAQARALMGRADLFLAPAPYGESYGIVLTEAMAAGAVPIAAANPGYASVMTGRGADLLVPPGDSAALADRIVTLASSQDLRRDLRAWGRDHAKALDIAAIGPRYADLFRQVLSDA